MKKSILFSATVALLSMVSCGENFFELTPNYEVAVNGIYKTADDFDLAVKGAYAKFQSQVAFYTELCEYRSDIRSRLSIFQLFSAMSSNHPSGINPSKNGNNTLSR